MISFTLTLLIALTYIVSNSDSVEYTVNQDNLSKSNSVMVETKYYENYEDLKSPPNTVVIYPIFTQSAYNWNGIHDFYTDRCDECTSVSIQNFYEKRFAASGNAFSVLEFLGYDIIDDIDLDKNPKILEDYDKVILLHNEFVTENEFNSIMEHQNVIYLYPNALTSKIAVDYSENTISLLQGPGFPDDSVTSGFDWIYDNSEYMDNWDCKDWKFEKISNGYMLNCYPEQFIVSNGLELLQKLRQI